MGAKEQVLNPADLAGVGQTAVLTLRARADEHHRPDRLFADPLAAEWMGRLAWPDALDAWYADGAQNNIALRVDDIDRLLLRVTQPDSSDKTRAEPERRTSELNVAPVPKSHPLTAADRRLTASESFSQRMAGAAHPHGSARNENATPEVREGPNFARAGAAAPVTGEESIPWTVVELGGGLSTRASRLADDLDADWVVVDLPNISAIRNSWSAPGRTISASVLDAAWLDAVDDIDNRPQRLIFVAEGLFYYLHRPAVDALLRRLGNRFPGAVLVMDVLGAYDFPKLAAHTDELGEPVQWHLEVPFPEVLASFGMQAIPGFEPDAIALQALARYLPRLPPTVRALSWWAINAQQLPPTRSGNIVGRLRPSPSSLRELGPTEPKPR